jgi:NitT/TauT family transport system permease protein
MSGHHFGQLIARAMKGIANGQATSVEWRTERKCRYIAVISPDYGRSSKSMSKVEAASSAQYRDWLRAERRGRTAVRAAQVAILVVFLVLWEILPRAQIINPLFTSYPSALWPTFLDLLKETPQQPSILSHTWATVFATVIGFTAAMVLGTIVAAALWWWDRLYKVLDPYLVVANAMPKTAFVPIFYIWLGAMLSVYAMSLAISLFITILMIYNGFQGIDPNKVKLAQTFGASRRQILTKVVLPGSVPTLIATLKVNAGLSLVGVVVGEFQSANLGLGYLIQYGSQIFRMNIVMTAITILAIVSSAMYLAISWLEAAVMRRR